MLEGHDLTVRPVEVIRDVGYLLPEQVEGVADYPPAVARSSSKV